MAASRKPLTSSTPFLKLVLNGRPDMSANTTLLTSARAVLGFAPSTSLPLHPSAHNSSPYACWHLPVSWFRPRRHVPSSPCPPIDTIAAPAGTTLPTLSNDASEIR